MPYTEYAKAFYDLASAEDVENFKVLVNCIDQDFISIMDSKRIGNYEKNRIVDEVIGKNELISSFFKVLVENNRFGLLVKINESLEKMLNEKNNIAKVDVIVSEELSKGKLKEVTETLSKAINKTVEANIIVDKDIIGGVKIKYEGKILDNSILANINDLRKELQK